MFGWNKPPYWRELKINWRRVALGAPVILAIFVVVYGIERAGYWPDFLTTYSLHSTDKRYSSRCLDTFLSASDAWQRDDFDEAIGTYSKALREPDLSTQDTVCLLQDRARIYDDAGRISSAEADWARAIELAPKQPDLYYSRGLFYRRNDRFSLAITDFRTGESLAPSDWRFPYGLGRVAAGRGENAAAIEHYDKALQLDSSAAIIHIWRGYAYSILRQYFQAIQDYDSYINSESRTQWYEQFARYGRARSYYMLEDYSTALADVEDLLEINPRHIDALKLRDMANEAMAKDPSRPTHE